MQRKGAMTKNPPLRGQARKDFKAARSAMVNQPAPQQLLQNVPQSPPIPSPNIAQQTRQVIKQPQSSQRPMLDYNSQEYQQMLQPYLQRQGEATQPMDKMFRFPAMQQQPQQAIGAVTGLGGYEAAVMPQMPQQQIDPNAISQKQAQMLQGKAFMQAQQRRPAIQPNQMPYMPNIVEG